PAPEPEGLLAALRRFKRRELLRIAVRDLLGLADLPATAAALADLADAAIETACRGVAARLVLEHGAPGAEFAVLGLGKLGGRELNFSSDVDLVYLCSTDQGETAGPRRIPLHVYFARLAEGVTRALSAVTELGFVFRVDLRLRPEGRAGSLVVPLRQAEIYYEGWGQTWERAALIKARPVAGSRALGEAFVRMVEPFVYRRYLDFTAIEEIRALKRRIDAELRRAELAAGGPLPRRGEPPGRLRAGGGNVKLGVGGIREIEFFVQALQLIHGGRVPAVRERGTLPALAALAARGLVRREEADRLAEAYVFLRTVEHRLQLVAERQTHVVPASPEALRPLARGLGFATVEAFQARLGEVTGRVSTLYRSLFRDGDDERPGEARWRELLAGGLPDEEVERRLAELGFADPARARENLRRLREGGPAARASERSRRRLTQLAPRLLAEIAAAPDPDMALAHLEAFIAAVGARSTYYALLQENPGTLSALVRLFGTSEFLSTLLIRRPDLLDALLLPEAAPPVRSPEEMAAALGAALAEAPDYERQLDALRRFRHLEVLRIGMADIAGVLDEEAVSRQLTALAETCLRAALDIAAAALAPRVGRPTTPYVVLGLGKLGGREMNYASDLDLLLVYGEPGETEPPPGGRRLTHQEYYARFVQRTVSVLATPTAEGVAFNVDMRLRPSGNQGPLVTSAAAFERYHAESAALWERQALIRARVVAGDPGLGERLAAAATRFVYERPLPPDAAAEIHRLRGRMERELARESAGRYNIKLGRGGLADVEFLVQYLQLVAGRADPGVRTPNTREAIERLAAHGVLPADAAARLVEAYRFLRRLENRIRIVHDRSIDELAETGPELARLARRLGQDRAALVEAYRHHTEAVRALYERYLGAPAQAPAAPPAGGG
ncbi:MAG TPA: bifunctional [glutamate--ammonia ligase]-adenylyl-L-tyrosine phosphorylase/[glutamate--ammonia-ligase] adenylyltransferase, partial [Thermodesulfobacteriota bacterium]|nr:bifunctional [glutamate--ammonia ligase]-adenylyl-L-tyrosine phosphorylase/[glutamate--ammonia-ligase] adenylyltransferase [Thermodesulfobacteriota bacterium]